MTSEVDEVIDASGAGENAVTDQAATVLPQGSTENPVPPPAPKGPEEKPRINGWYFPELEGPDVTRDLVDIEVKFLKELQTTSISDIWDLDLESEPNKSVHKIG